MTQANKAILKADSLSLKFGGVQALSNVSIDLLEREILAIIGPNGAGKTSFVNCVNGFYRPQKGGISFRGHKINNLPPFKIAKLGLARTFQNIALYTGLTTYENLMAARHVLMKKNLLSCALYFGGAIREESIHREAVEHIIDFLELQPARKQVVSHLPYGTRKRVELGRALALEPKLLLLDEPMAGMNVEEKETMARFIVDIYEQRKIPILLIEHDMGVVMDIADRVVVLDFGIKIAEGRPAGIIRNEKVLNAYLGSEEAEFTSARENI